MAKYDQKQRRTTSERKVVVFNPPPKKARVNWFITLLMVPPAIGIVWLLFGHGPGSSGPKASPKFSDLAVDADQPQMPEMIQGGEAPVPGALYSAVDPKTGKSTPVFHVMGPNPIVNTGVHPETKEQMQFNDDNFYQVIVEASELMGTTYQAVWEKWLKQTTLAPDDPSRNWYILLKGAPYAGGWQYANDGIEDGVQARFIRHPENPEVMAMAFLDVPILAWEEWDLPRKQFFATYMVHEMRHQEDYLNHRELLYGATNYFGQLMDKRKGRFTADDVQRLHDRATEVLARELIAFETEFMWVERYGKELMQTDWFTQSELWKAWRSKDRRRLAEELYQGYESEIWMPDVITGKPTEAEKELVINRSLQLVEKVYESGGGPAV